MIHPSVEQRWISPSRGYGLFAKEFIPMGTITFVQDSLDIVIEENDPRMNDAHIRAYIEKYSYMNSLGQHIISWDGAKFMNHCCHANTLTTGYGFEIAVRDILANEEVTDDYGIFTLEHEMQIDCKASKCRLKVSSNDFHDLVTFWDDKIQTAFSKFENCDQPLLVFVDPEIKSKLIEYLNTGHHYQSVALQKPTTQNLVGTQAV